MDIKNKPHSEKERWVCIYPAYINSKKTRAEGRRIPLNKAIENPNYQEIRDVLAAANFIVGVENKKYPRERSNEPQIRGRIRVQFRNDDGSPANPAFPSRESLLVHCGEMIPKLKSRTDKSSRPQEQPAQAGAGKKKNKKK